MNPYNPPRFAALVLTCLLAGLAADARAADAPGPESVAVAPDGRGFVRRPSGRPFVPWGLNYGNAGRLMEDFWEHEWRTIADDFGEMKALGANVVRVHLQFGKFMSGPDEPNEAALAHFARLLELAERTGLYLDVTGLACYRTTDVPAWYDALDEAGRWAAQARFWEAVAARGAGSPAVFCYCLMNEPLSPGAARKPGDWYSGKPFGGYDFLQFITLDPRGRPREQVARLWIKTLTAAIRRKDDRHLITVGLLPKVAGWGHLSGFLPETVGPELDFMSVHVYPEKGKVADAVKMLDAFKVAGKPLVIEETFPLHCPASDLREFLVASKATASGWVAHYDGSTVEELDDLKRSGEITAAQSVWLEGLALFRDVRAEMTDGPTTRRPAAATRP